MRSADDCLARARELSRLADLSVAPTVTHDLLEMAEHWLNLARKAGWQEPRSFTEPEHRPR